MKKYLLFPLILCGKFAFSQLNESFNDGNLTSSPVWTGSNSGNDFIVVTDQLRSNSTTASSNLYLSTVNNLATSCQWEFWVNLQFNPSGANYVDVYLTSDQANLQSASINGYFVRLGNTNDEVCLFKRSGTTASSTKLIDGIDGILNTSNNKVKIRVTRTASNVFTLERDITGLGTSYITEGTFQDASVTTSGYFGIFIQQFTSSFFQKHFFDDFKINALNFDTSPPKLLSATVVDSTSLEILFDEPVDSVSAKSLSNYSINNNYGNPISVKTTADASKYSLELSKGLITASFLLTVSNIKDKAGNLISSDKTATFSFIKPFRAVKGDIIINEIFSDPSPQIDLPSVEFIELLNTANQTISLKNWKYSDPASTAILPADSIKSGEYLILCAKADTSEFKHYGKTLGLSPWPTLNNASDIIKLVSPENKTIDSVAYSDTWYPTAIKKQGGWSLERINYKSACPGLFNWTAATDSAGGTPGKQNSVFIPNYDQLAFKADSIQYLSDSTLNVYFNKPADISASNNSFNLSPVSGNLKALVFDSSAKQAKLTYSSKFSPDTSYQLSVSQLKDCAGNSIGLNTFQFTTPKLPPVRLDTGRICITEIFADPSPEIRLPLAEFVEIFNPGKDTIDLDGWTLNDPTTKALVSKRLIFPKEYIILCPSADTLQYKQYGKTIGLTPWPSLNNTSDQITLKSFKGRLTDSISYSDTWHQTNKKQGGWSLERVDFNSVCGGIFNWTSSVDTSGGTPGRQNSVNIPNYDRVAFNADSMKQTSDSTLTVYFNKSADPSTANNSFSINPASGTLKSASFDLKAKEAALLFSNSFLHNTSYQLSISDLKDCTGKTIIQNTLSFTTQKLPPVRLDTAKLYITEILADPSPEVQLPLVEFVEIYNPGKDTIDLDGWTLNTSSSKAVLKKISIFPKEYLILCPASDTTQYKTFGKTSGLSPWPVLNNSSGQIFIKSFKGRLVDSIAYGDTFHSATTKKQGGWSLERIDFSSVCQGLFNWTSSIDIFGGSPGKANAAGLNNYDQIAFKADSIKQASDTSVHVYFNKHADISTSLNAFTLNPAANIKAVHFDTKARVATLELIDSLSANTSYHLNISQLKDCAGNEITPNNTLSFITPTLSPIRTDTARLFITEIFADPSPEVKLPLAEFVEIFNPGKDTIDLDSWTLHTSSGKTTIRKISISPNNYLVLCPAADTSQYQSFGQTKGISQWPGLSNASGQVFMKSFKGRMVDSISYHDSFHSSAHKKQGGWSIERIDVNSVCKGAFNWTSSIDPSGGTPGRKNSVSVNNNDLITFKTDSIKQISDTSIQLFFNKYADVSTAINAFSLEPGSGNIKSITFSEKPKDVRLVFTEKFIENTDYKLKLSQLKDCAGNTIITNTLNFTAPKLPPVRLDTANLVITEIFADPSPEVKLPLVEFIEIYNPGKDTIYLDGWTLNDPTTKTILKNASILPQQYLILCPLVDTLLYNSYGKTLGLSPWPPLNNASDQITLRSFKGRSVDSILYKDSWYRDSFKKSGGWSLERIENQSICTASQNWMASNNPDGGTPGMQNSVHKLNSNQPLTIIQASLIDSLNISLKFNRAPDSLIASNPDNYTINNGAGKPSAVKINSDAFNEVSLQLSGPIHRGSTYKVTGSNIADCSGTLVSSSNNFAEFFYPDKVQKGDILISEILFNPRTGGADFIEIYNNSNHLFDLKDISVSTIKAPDSIINRKKLTDNSKTLEPGAYLVLTTDPDNIKAEYHTENPHAFLKVASMPAFNNAEGSVVILSGESRIDQLDYNEKMHFRLIKDPKGVSLERSAFNRPSNDPGNFRSAAASAGYATPGYKNSQSVGILLQASEEIVLGSKTLSPDNDGFEDALQINYKFKDAGLVANVSVYDDNGILIRRLAKNITLAAEGTLTWDGMTDNEQRAEIGVYIVYFDVFNLDGKSKKFRKACVLAAKLN
ncbi:lamin tail domain-containing protein [Pedobacter sp. P351]|uniref:lamin tail domain-containing protein n=1 Tax=Pedobacter superstes TaxID=3133441 RepID=UPI0030A4C446